MNPIASVCETLAEAFIDDPFYQAVTVDFPESEGKRRFVLAEYFRLAIEEAIGIGEVQYANEDGAAIWITGEASDDAIEMHGTVRTRALSKLLGSAGFENYVYISQSMARNVPPHLAGAWYLSVLGVRPAARGQCLAHRLVELTLSRADRQEAPCFLETFNPLSLPFYHRLGFDHEIPCFETITGRPYWILTRNVQK